jgi:HK97 family phage prohead protease/HK97 family phage major capsid protein
MMNKNKVLYVNSTFTKQAPPGPEDGIQSIYIEGYASTIDVDRMNDVIPSSVWEKGLVNYLRNPIILSQHDHDDPIGRMVDYKIDPKGLWIKARISAAAEQVYGLVKDGVVTAFSVGFRVIDAAYDAATELFVIKELELVEISVVSIPANQNTLFSLSKAFSDADEYKKFKSQFITADDSAKKLESLPPVNLKSHKEVEMTEDQIKQMVADAAAAAALETTKALEAKQKAEADAAELDARLKAVEIQTAESGAERLMAEIEKRFADQAESTKSMLDGLQGAIAEKAAEIEAIQKSKMTFVDNKQGGPSYKEKENAVLLANISRKSLTDTKYAQDLIQKYGQHLPSATWELEVSLNMEEEVRRKLIVAPLFRTIDMKTNVMTIPLNPDAGLASWVQNTDFGGTSSVGGTTATTTGTVGVGTPHAIKEVTLNAYKVATREYLNYEEEEDSLIVLLPFIRDAMVRRIARSIDRAYLQGKGADTDPVKGLTRYANVNTTTRTSVVTAAVASGSPVTVANLRAMRANLGVLGPSEVTFIVNSDVYYNLLDDEKFQTMNQVGVQATLLTGQIGQIGNSPVLVSGELAPKPTAGKAGTVAGTGADQTTTWEATKDDAVGALAIYTPNFVIGNQRGLRMDTQELVETQRRVMVASMRTGFQQMSSAYGPGVVTLRYAS